MDCLKALTLEKFTSSYFTVDLTHHRGLKYVHEANNYFLTKTFQ